MDLLHFEQLKKEIQAQYLKNNTASCDDISKWKGIDIVYFQEDLRKTAKGNISEKSFYRYFKTAAERLPRIDMLNLLSIYAGYGNWYDFKKQHLFKDETLGEPQEEETEFFDKEEEIFLEKNEIAEEENKGEKSVLQISTGENQQVSKNSKKNTLKNFAEKFPVLQKVKKLIWLIVSVILAVCVLILVFWQEIFATRYIFTFIDSDRGTKLRDNIEIKILKNNESPILYNVKSGEDFVYSTKNKTLTMVVASAFYKNDTIHRNLDPANTREIIALVPDDYAMTLYYYSTNSNSIKDLKLRRAQLNSLISNNALIYQVFDNEIYGVETLSKEKYIGLVTTPTTSLKHFQMIETQTNKQGKITLIKFKINIQDENAD